MQVLLHPLHSMPRVCSVAQRCPSADCVLPNREISDTAGLISWLVNALGSLHVKRARGNKAAEHVRIDKQPGDSACQQPSSHHQIELGMVFQGCSRKIALLKCLNLRLLGTFPYSTILPTMHWHRLIEPVTLLTGHFAHLMSSCFFFHLQGYVTVVAVLVTLLRNAPTPAWQCHGRYRLRACAAAWRSAQLQATVTTTGVKA